MIDDVPVKKNFSMSRFTDARLAVGIPRCGLLYRSAKRMFWSNLPSLANRQPYGLTEVNVGAAALQKSSDGPGSIRIDINQ